MVCIGFSVFFFFGLWYLVTRIGKSSQLVERPSIRPAVGRWRLANDAVEIKSSFEREVEKLSSLPYLQGYYKAPLEQNVTVYDVNLACDGLNLYNSGHAAEAGIMDMNGNILHKWTYNFEDILRKKQKNKTDAFWKKPPLWKEASTHWRRVYLYENGDILAVYDSLCMIKLDKDSNLLGVSGAKGVHHHMQVIDNGNIYVLTKKLRMVPRVNKYEPIIEDYITILGPEGKVIEECSLLESFENSSYAYILDKMRSQGELFHTNTLHVFDGSLSHISPLYKKGNVLICVLFLNAIAVVDLEKNQVVWALEGHENGLWNGMHEPVLLKNGNILIFDNDWGKEVNGKSKVIEFNPFTKEIVWQYRGDEEHPFYSRTCGTNQRLPNGNTLITESDNGRAFEVTRDGKIVWEYVSPHRAGENNELIATLLHMRRIDRDSVKWLVLEQQK